LEKKNNLDVDPFLMIGLICFFFSKSKIKKWCVRSGPSTW